MRMEEGDLLPAWDVGDPLEEVALTYRLAHAAGEPPTKAVMERLDISRSSASRGVAKAREKGLLGPAMERKAGEKRARRREGK
jgi:Mn-dependent DtxR family transcriptional regulator